MSNYLKMCSWACLAEPVRLLDRYRKAFVDIVHKFCGKRRSCGHENSDSAKIVVIDHRRLAEEQENWWNEVCVRDLMILEGL